jgi:hypothetical protein
VARHEKITRIEGKHARRIAELSLAACALSGLVRSGFTGPVDHDHQAIVMQHLDTLFGFTPVESAHASDRLFEQTLNHSIPEWDRANITQCATELTRIASVYRGTEDQDREIWLAGFNLFETDSLWDAAQPPETAPRFDPVFADTSASLRYFDRI